MARPSEYDPGYCERVLEMGEKGWSKVQMANALGVVRNTLDNWAKAHPEFLNALSRACEASQAWWEREAQKGIYTRDFNAALWAKSMSARFPNDYRDNSKIELGGPAGGPIQIDDATTAAKIAAILEAAKKRKGDAELA